MKTKANGSGKPGQPTPLVEYKVWVSKNFKHLVTLLESDISEKEFKNLVNQARATLIAERQHTQGKQADRAWDCLWWLGIIEANKIPSKNDGTIMTGHCHDVVYPRKSKI